MSFFASALRAAYKLSGAKKAFTLPEEEILKVIEKQNRSRGVFTPTDHKACYEMIDVNGFPCLIVRAKPEPSERAILYFFGGGMVVGPDRGDLPVMRKLMQDTGCDVWFPFYPLCTEHCITETYEMAYECYRRMTELYGGGNVSTCGFSSGGALALGIAAHNSALGKPLPQPRHIVAVSPGEVPWNDAEKARMQALNSKDVAIDYAFMVTVEKFMRHGQDGRTGLYDLRFARRLLRCGRYPLLLLLRRGALRARCRTLRKPVSARTFRTPPLQDRRWCTATACCRASGRQRRTLLRSRTF